MERKPNGRFRLKRVATRGPVGVVLLALLAVCPYLNALQADFVFDDRLLIIDHPAISESFDLGTSLTSSFLSGVQDSKMWRPLVTLSYALDHQIAGSAPWWPHVVNLVLHLAVTLLLYATIRLYFGLDHLAWIVSALFAVHPIHTEAVTWVAGRAELMAGGFGLAALCMAVSRRALLRGLTPAVVLLAVGSKESAVAIPWVLLYSAWALRTNEKRHRVLPGIASIGSVVVYFIARRFVLGTWAGSEINPGDNPMVGTAIMERFPTVLDCAGRYFSLFFWPARLSADYSAPVLLLADGMTAFSILGLLILVGLSLLAFFRRSHPEGWGAGFVLLTFAIASNLPIVIGTIFAERLLYLPSAGLILIVASAAVAIAKLGWWFDWAMRALLFVVVITGGLRTWDRNRDYRSEEAFYEEGARTQPRSPKMRANYALVLSRKERYEEAIHEAGAALSLDSSLRNAREVAGYSLEQLGRTDEALAFLRPIVQADPADRLARRRLIRLLVRLGNRAAADSVIEAGVLGDPETTEWMIEAAASAQQQAHYHKAIRYWKETERRDPGFADALLSLGFCYLMIESPDKARGAYANALQRNPESAEAANGLAWSILEVGGPAEEAIRYALRAVELSPSAPNYDTLARAHLTAGECNEALDAAAKAVELNPSHISYRTRLNEIEERCK